jgi:hypothetical protein
MTVIYDWLYIYMRVYDSTFLSNVEMESASIPSALMEMKTRRLQTQPSTLDTRKRHAVCVRRAFKKYGSKKNPHVVLDGLNMTVPKGVMQVFFINILIINHETISHLLLINLLYVLSRKNLSFTHTEKSKYFSSISKRIKSFKDNRVLNKEFW